MNTELERTANRGGLLEDLRHLSIHLNHYIFLEGYSIVPQVDLLLHPLRELFLEHAGAHVAEPGFRRFGQLDRGLGEVLVHLRVMLIQVGPDLFDSQAFVSIQ